MFYKFLRWIIYPLTLSISIILFFALIHADDKHSLAITAAILFSIAVVLLCEKYMPYNNAWKAEISDLKNDGLYFALIQTLLPNILTGLTAIFVSRFIKDNHLAILNIWPHHLPVWIQEIMVILISDFLRYWLHRFNHTLPSLWRLHAVHHSVNKLYWMNTARFHPLEKAMQFMMDVFPFMLLGISEEVIALHLVLYGVNGFFQHSNIDLKFGWLNYIISSPELHRWHHSRETRESNNNYGNNVIVWDLLFGTYYLPENTVVGELGLINRKYPMDFKRQMKAPLSGKLDKIDMPQASFRDWILNSLLKLKMFISKYRVYSAFINETRNCAKIQEEILFNIINKNKETKFGKDHHFAEVSSYLDFQELVPVGDYEALWPYIKMQASEPSLKAVMDNEILMFNKTSGTTSTPKLIPVCRETFKSLKASQDLMFYMQYQLQPMAFHGKILGITSPATEGMSEFQIPTGSASGHFLKNVSPLVSSKYVIPYEVLEIKEYELKYYVILLFCLHHKDITYIGTANPSTFLKMAEILSAKKEELLYDFKSGNIKDPGIENYPEILKAYKRLKPDKNRISEIEYLFSSGRKISFADLWPWLKLMATWTGGSCGIALRAVQKLMPEGLSVMDLGYVSSEFRGTVTFDVKTQAGLPTFRNNFFEFAERESYENGLQEFVLLHQLLLDKEYYIFITTPSGLYRYNMNDVIRVTGFINNFPLIKFIQKGKGVCNITGEKLYESQLLKAMEELQLDYRFVQAVANEEQAQYEFFMETNGPLLSDTSELALELDRLLCLQNYEYSEKRASNRLKQILVLSLRKGTADILKQLAVSKGQNESQYKTIMLQYKNKLPYNLDDFVV